MNDKQTAIFLLAMLRAILNEQSRAKLLDKETADYIYAAMKDQCAKLGWVD